VTTVPDPPPPVLPESPVVVALPLTAVEIGAVFLVRRRALPRS
jgi:hypothetical protein